MIAPAISTMPRIVRIQTPTVPPGPYVKYAPTWSLQPWSTLSGAVSTASSLGEAFAEPVVQRPHDGPADDRDHERHAGGELDHRRTSSYASRSTGSASTVVPSTSTSTSSTRSNSG